jgi:hypothetical protein
MILQRVNMMTRKTCIDQKSILMIGGIKVFLPYSPVEAREDVLPMQQQQKDNQL